MWGPVSDLVSASRAVNIYVAMGRSPTISGLASGHLCVQVWALLTSGSKRERGFLPHARLRPTFWYSQFPDWKLFLFPSMKQHKYFSLFKDLWPLPKRLRSNPVVPSGTITKKYNIATVFSKPESAGLKEKNFIQIIHTTFHPFSLNCHKILRSSPTYCQFITYIC